MELRSDCEAVLIRGPRGQKGSPGLSAYGVWLMEGNVGTVEDFFNSLLPEDIYYSHTGGQVVLPHCCVALELRYSSAKPRKTRGNYIVNYFTNARSGRFSLYVSGAELPQACFPAGCTGTAVVYDCFFEEISLVNKSDSPIVLKGSSGTDAFLHLRRIK